MYAKMYASKAIIRLIFSELELGLVSKVVAVVVVGPRKCSLATMWFETKFQA